MDKMLDDGSLNISSYFTLILNGNINSLFPVFLLRVAFSSNIICILWILYFNFLILLR